MFEFVGRYQVGEDSEEGAAIAIRWIGRRYGSMMEPLAQERNARVVGRNVARSLDAISPASMSVRRIDWRAVAEDRPICIQCSVLWEERAAGHALSCSPCPWNTTLRRPEHGWLVLHCTIRRIDLSITYNMAFAICHSVRRDYIKRIIRFVLSLWPFVWPMNV